MKIRRWLSPNHMYYSRISERDVTSAFRPQHVNHMLATGYPTTSESFYGDSNDRFLSFDIGVCKSIYNERLYAASWFSLLVYMMLTTHLQRITKY